MKNTARAAAVLLMTGVSMPALAQVQPAEDTAKGGLSDIVVTAERRTQSLQNVPISATVLTGEELQKKGVTNLNDIQQVAPSIAIHAFLKKSASEELLAQLASKEAFGRGAEPWEVANVMVFLASGYSSYLTGEVISVSSQHA